MNRAKQHTHSSRALEEGREGARHPWIAPTVLLLLIAGAVQISSRLGLPFVVSFLDVVLLVALGVVSGTYLILAGAGRTRAEGPEEPPTRGGAEGDECVRIQEGREP